MRRLIPLVMLLSAVLFPNPAGAQQVPPDDDLTGEYRGFAQSAITDDLRLPMALEIDRGDDEEFFGFLTLGPMPFSFKGKVDAAGHFKGRGTGEAGDVTFVGTAQGFGNGGVLARAAYKFTPATGARADQGVADFIRAPQAPPDPVVPIAGSYPGTFASGAGRGPGKVDLHLDQEGTSIAGRIVMDAGTARELAWDVVGGILPCTVSGAGCTHEVVLIGAGDGRLLAGGAVSQPPDPFVPAMLGLTFAIEFLGGGVDLGTVEARRSEELR